MAIGELTPQGSLDMGLGSPEALPCTEVLVPAGNPHITHTGGQSTPRVQYDQEAAVEREEGGDRGGQDAASA